MNIHGFVTSYRTDDNIRHIYFFPGKNESGNPLYKMYFITKDIDYRYSRESDGAIDYIIINSNTDEVQYSMQNIITGETKTYTIKL